MVPLDNLLAFTAAALVIILIPGPAVLFSVGRTLAIGRRGWLMSVAGVALALVPIVALVAFGVGGVIAQSVVLLTALKIVGALYLAFLGVQAIRHRRLGATAPAPGEVASAPTTPAHQLWQGFVVGVTNPKTLAFFVAVLPQFVDVRAGAVPWQMLELGLVFAVIALLSDSAWVLAASAARAWFARSPRRLEVMTATGGGLMIGLGGVLLVTGGGHSS